MSYKDTVRLPKTLMPIKSNLAAQAQRYKEWEEKNVYARMTGENPFIVHDGPPYANGDIHVGHALNKILKDFAAKFQYFQGRNIQFIPGWDCHGLPIEKKVAHKTAHHQSVVELRECCAEYALRQFENQREQFKELGVVADWDNPYLTMSESYRANIFTTLRKLQEKQLICEDFKPVFWSWAERTALAEAEIEYVEVVDDTAYVLFKGEECSLLIWTTTPWTLPANVAVAVHPNANYELVRKGDELFYVASAQVQLLLNKGIVDRQTGRQVLGSELDGQILNNPLNSKIKSKVVMAEFVAAGSVDETTGNYSIGTGCVHIAPGHGEQDYLLKKSKNLPLKMYVGPDGKFTEQVAEINSDYVGLHVLKEANERILNDLGDHLLCKEKIQHKYPYCQRSNTPVIFRATQQWFLKLPMLHDEVIDNLNNVKFYPENSNVRLLSMVDNRTEWCLSRQRLWGVPLAMFRNKQTGEIFSDPKVDALLLEKGVDQWYVRSLEEFGYSQEYEKINDVLDVWFDSGVSWQTLDRPADVVIEGTDQHRGWFQSMLWLATAMKTIPYKKIVTHGFILDSERQKMAKSKGNTLAPKELIKNFGADVLRFWVASADYTKEIKISKEILESAEEGCRKLRNTLRFLVSNLESKQEGYSLDLLFIQPADAWILNKSRIVFEKVKNHFEEYDYSGGLYLLMGYINNELSGVYVNSIKDRLYCGGERERNGAVYALEAILRSLLGLIAPLFTYTADEVLSYAPERFRQGKDIFDWKYQALPLEAEQFDGDFWTEALTAFHVEFDRIKTAGIAKDTLAVSLISEDVFDGMENWFVVAGVNQGGQVIGEFKVGEKQFSITLSDRKKCQRCWKLNADNELCERCQTVLKGL